MILISYARMFSWLIATLMKAMALSLSCTCILTAKGGELSGKDCPVAKNHWFWYKVLWFTCVYWWWNSTLQQYYRTRKSSALLKANSWASKNIKMPDTHLLLKQNRSHLLMSVFFIEFFWCFEMSSMMCWMECVLLCFNGHAFYWLVVIYTYYREGSFSL